MSSVENNVCQEKLKNWYFVLLLALGFFPLCASRGETTSLGVGGRGGLRATQHHTAALELEGRPTLFIALPSWRHIFAASYGYGQRWPFEAQGRKFPLSLMRRRHEWTLAWQHKETSPWQLGALAQYVMVRQGSEGLVLKSEALFVPYLSYKGSGGGTTLLSLPLEGVDLGFFPELSSRSFAFDETHKGMSVLLRHEQGDFREEGSYALSGGLRYFFPFDMMEAYRRQELEVQGYYPLGQGWGVAGGLKGFWDSYFYSVFVDKGVIFRGELSYAFTAMLRLSGEFGWYYHRHIAKNVGKFTRLDAMLALSWSDVPEAELLLRPRWLSREPLLKRGEFYPLALP